MFSGLLCRSDHLDVVGYLVNEAHCDPNVKSKKGETPLHRACRLIGWCMTYCTCTGTIVLIWAQNSNRGETQDFHTITVRICLPSFWFYVCREGRPDIVRYLVTEAGCDPNARDGSEQTPLHWACRWAQSAVIVHRLCCSFRKKYVSKPLEVHTRLLSQNNVVLLLCVCEILLLSTL